MGDSGGGWRDSYKGMSSDNIKGLVLAISSSLFIGASFIVKKKGLKKAASTGTRAGKSRFIFSNVVSGSQFWCWNCGCRGQNHVQLTKQLSLYDRLGTKFH